MLRLEFANLQVHSNEQSQPPVEEQDINEILFAADICGVV
jgi:hypothetical protein